MAMISLDASSIAVKCGACPTIHTAREIESGDEVTMHFRYRRLTVTKGFTTLYSEWVEDAEGEGLCSFEVACRAADIAVIDPETGDEIDAATVNIADEQ